MSWYVLYRESGRTVMQPTEEQRVALDRACQLLALGHDVREVGPMRDDVAALDAAELRRIWQERRSRGPGQGSEQAPPA